jgi:hypothetical protein
MKPLISDRISLSYIGDSPKIFNEHRVTSVLTGIWIDKDLF